MTTKQRVVTADRFLGINQKKDPAELASGKKGYELVEALDVDITDNLKVRRRQGYTSWRTSACRKIWANDNVFVSVEGATLFTLNQDATVNSVRTDLHPTKVPDFVNVGDEAYYSDGKVTGKFNADGDHTDWAVEEPLSYPNMAATAGTLHAGCYRVAMTYVHDDGRESGTGKSITIDLADESSGISLTSIPQPVSGNIDKINIYCTEANGGRLLHAKQLAVGTTSTVINSKRLGDELSTQFLAPPPPGDQVAFAASRVGVAVDEFLFLSEPFTYHLFSLHHGYVVFNSPITMVAQTQLGMYVSADAMYFLDLSQEKPQPKRLMQAKAIKGSKFYIDAVEFGEEDGNQVFAGWTAENGVLIGGEGGSISNLTEGRIDIGESPSGAAMVRKSRGITQIVTSTRSAQGGNMYVGDIVTAEVIRKRNIEETINLIDEDGNPVIDEDGEPIINTE